jgi:hypothetical protein
VVDKLLTTGALVVPAVATEGSGGGAAATAGAPSGGGLSPKDRENAVANGVMQPLVLATLAHDAARLAFMVLRLGADLSAARVLLPTVPAYCAACGRRCCRRAAPRSCCRCIWPSSTTTSRAPSALV